MMRRSRHRRLRGAFLLVAGIGTVLVAGCNGAGGDHAEAFRPIAVGALVPELTVRTLAGDSARIAPGEAVTLLNVWATWCGPCQAEFPELQALERDFGPRGLRIVAVSVDEGDDSPVREFVNARGATFEIGRDPDGVVRRLYQGIGVPESYLISADGRLITRQFGALPAGAAAMRAAIERALAAARTRARPVRS